LSFDYPGPANAQSPDFGDCEIVVELVPNKTTTSKFRALLTCMLAFEFRIFGAFLEKVTKSSIQMAEGLLQRYGRWLTQPCRFSLFLPLSKRRAGGAIGQARGCCLVSRRAQRQATIIDVPNAAEQAFQGVHLATIGIESKSMLDLHGVIRELVAL
jgi:hypothetical protein